ncbi:MAG: hypothetical protein ACI841_003693, partial [Planctomycetota bacterium]
MSHLVSQFSRLPMLAFRFPVALALAATTVQAQCISESLTASIPSSGDRFGSAIAVDGDTAAIGGWNTVRIFERSAGVWQEQQTVTNGEAGYTGFGSSIALHGDLLAVGAVALFNGGHVYVYRRQAGTWVLQNTLRPASCTPLDQFGKSVAVWNDVLVVGAPTATYSTYREGALHILRENAGVWTEELFQTPPASWGSAQLGLAVDIDSGRVVASGPWADLLASNDVGRAQVLEFNGASWNTTAELVTSDPQTFDIVGWSGISLSGDTVALTASSASDWNGGTNCCSTGFVYLFEQNGGLWAQSQKLAADDAAPGASFGRSVDLLGDTLLVGAHEDPQMGYQAGAVYVFDRELSGWEQREKRPSPDGFAGELFGDIIALAGSSVLVGVPTNDELAWATGSVAEFDLMTPARILASPYCYGDAHCLCGDTYRLGGCRNSTQLGATLRACSTSSVSADDLVLTLDQAPVHQFGLLFMGGGAPDLPFGDGRFCVGAGGSGVFRFPIRSTAGSGSFVQSSLVQYSQQNFGANGTIVPGSTWRFQGWFRDPLG